MPCDDGCSRGHITHHDKCGIFRDARSVHIHLIAVRLSRTFGLNLFGSHLQMCSFCRHFVLYGRSLCGKSLQVVFVCAGKVLSILRQYTTGVSYLACFPNGCLLLTFFHEENTKALAPHQRNVWPLTPQLNSFSTPMESTLYHITVEL